MQAVLAVTGSKPVSQAQRERRFFFAMSVASTVAVFLGFSRTYYLRGYFGSPRVPLLFAVHGIVFSCWMLYFVAQSWLALDGHFKLHRQMGMAGAVLASLMVVLGVGVTFASARLQHFRAIPGATNSSEACLFSLFDIGLFGASVWAGFQWRLNAAVHQRLMILAIVVPLLPSAIGRLWRFQPAGAVPMILAFMLAGPAFDLLTRRRIHKAYLIGLGITIATAPPLRILLARTPAWQWAFRHMVGS